ncbi:MAG: cell division protein ZapE [Pelagibacteraceae bacterium]|nr:cell division protein ZapE [Pelagibacteraceae bacterium]|tara:strand:+ start:5016 stop:6053 length:1038 start_codon:yes stop_codon:yes gene_type:complete
MDENLQQSFLRFCKTNQFEINPKQVEIINLLENFISIKKSFFNVFKKDRRLCFYLHGGVGVGKTMLLNFFYNNIKIKKNRMHFNEFMINFHNYRHKEKDDNSITNFVKILKQKYDLIYLDEFQVTNIVDAMILGKLFEVIFKENIKIIITTNIKLNDLYKDGLQREQFLPFIEIIKKNSISKELVLDDDYRKQNLKNVRGIYYPLNEKTTFKINQNFRILTRDKKGEPQNIETKGRKFLIDNFYEGIAKFNFDDLCDKKLGSEDYINLANVSKHVFILNIPVFNDVNSNQQLRFITLIDIFYEKKIELTISCEKNLEKLGSSQLHKETFKRTLSRLYEMTVSLKR